ncbi:MAG: Uma2 family endonuclease [Rhizobiaceae bacterium]|jgi:Uma2 family endonuclease
MNLQTRYPTTPDEFLRWNEGREGKREFVRGRVVELMINTTKNHARLAARLTAALLAHLPFPPYTVGSADFGVKTPDGVRYPDIFVDMETATSKGTDLAASHPLLLAEILSPSSYSRDFGEKVADYTGLPTLKHYLILSQDEPRIWLWSREAADAWQGPEQVFGLDGEVRLAAFGITLNLGELYQGMFGQGAN